MGLRKCMAFGCKSVQKRGNTTTENGKVHFFRIPQADVELWQRALLRTDIVIKPGHLVCERHFAEMDLLWRRELRGPDGEILGVSADYKSPKLRTGALPSLHLGITPPKVKKGVKRGRKKKVKTEVIAKSIVKKSTSKSKESVSKGAVMDTCKHTDNTDNIIKVVQTYKVDSNATYDHNYYIAHNDYNGNNNTYNGNNNTYNGNNNTINNLHSKITNSKLILMSNSQQKELEIENNMQVEDILQVPGEIKETPLFETILLNEKSVMLPSGWCRQNMNYAGKRIVHFGQFVPKMENGIIQPVCTKQVLVNENLDTSVLVMRQQVDNEISGIRNEPLQNIEELEKLLMLVNTWKLCFGISMNSIDNVQVLTVKQDKEGVWRNVQCSLILPGTARNGCCEKCRSSKKVIAGKIIRLKSGSVLQRLRVTLSEPQKRKLDDMRKEMRSLRRGRDRALARIKILKDQRELDLQKFTASQKTLKQLIIESNLVGNQKLVMLEIMAASKQTDTRARRYSRVWMSYCLTLHRKSPLTYRFLRATNVLPLPAPRTVLKFAQHNPPVTDNISTPNDKMDTVEEIIEDVIHESEEFVNEIPDVEVETEVLEATDFLRLHS